MTSSIRTTPITTTRPALPWRSCGSSTARVRTAAGPEWHDPPDGTPMTSSTERPVVRPALRPIARQAGGRSDRDVVAAMRAEMAALDPARQCDRVALAAGLGADGWRREAVVARLAVRLDANAKAGGTGFDWSAAREHCRLAYLRGRFLARGSLSLAG